MLSEVRVEPALPAAAPRAVPVAPLAITPFHVQERPPAPPVKVDITLAGTAPVLTHTKPPPPPPPGPSNGVVLFAPLLLCPPSPPATLTLMLPVYAATSSSTVPPAPPPPAASALALKAGALPLASMVKPAPVKEPARIITTPPPFPPGEAPVSVGLEPSARPVLLF